VTAQTVTFDDEGGRSIFGRRYRLVTLGILAIMFLLAFENLAVTTVMPVVSAELHGASLYAVAFSAPLAVGVVGMVVAGNWSDRSGPAGPLFASVVLFAVGLVIAGTAPNMPLLVVGRLVYGLAGGATGVALYVIIARVFPEGLQTRMFGALAAAWVVPALVGPAIAGIVADTVGWRWVFLGVVVLVGLAVVMVVPSLKMMKPTSDSVVELSARRVVYAVVLAVAVLGLSLSSQLRGWLEVATAVVSIAVAIIAVRPLLPAGSLSSRRGLPSVIALRALLSAAYFGAEVYVPYLLTTRFGLTPAIAGLSLTGAGVAWGAASVLQGRVSDRMSPNSAVRIGIASIFVAVFAALGTALFDLPVWVAIVGWAIGGAGMGTLTPRLSVLLFSYSNPDNQGFNSSALSIGDAGGPGVSLALAGILFAGIGAGGNTPFVAVFIMVGVLVLVGLLISGRLFVRGRPAVGAPATAGNPLP
jgi:MFS family permease